MSVIYRQRHRHWLNPKGSDDTGTVSSFTIIDTHEEWGDDHESSLLLRDCSRQINLNFSCNASKASINRRRSKLAKLRKHLDLIEDGLNRWEKHNDSR